VGGAFYLKRIFKAYRQLSVAKKPSFVVL
jgi:hypothetical protein